MTSATNQIEIVECHIPSEQYEKGFSAPDSIYTSGCLEFDCLIRPCPLVFSERITITIAHNLHSLAFGNRVHFTRSFKNLVTIVLHDEQK